MWDKVIRSSIEVVGDQNLQVVSEPINDEERKEDCKSLLYEPCNVKQVQPGKHRTKAQAAMLFTSGKMTNLRCGTSGAAAPPVAIEAAKDHYLLQFLLPSFATAVHNTWSVQSSEVLETFPEIEHFPIDLLSSLSQLPPVEWFAFDDDPGHYELVSEVQRASSVAQSHGGVARKSIATLLECRGYQVANAARNIEIFRDRPKNEGDNKRDRDDHRIRPSETPSQGSNLRADDRRDSDRYGNRGRHGNRDRYGTDRWRDDRQGSDRHGNSSDRQGNGSQKAWRDQDQQVRGQHYSHSYGSSSQSGYPDYNSCPPCNLCGKFHPGKACHRATGACFECGEVGHLAKDCKKGSTSSGGKRF
ncbi:zinc finger, CCHC-type, retrotransposon gag domain protein, partial [Tanacetum coccineum]